MPGKGLPGRIDLEEWAPPDSRVARDAEEYMREVSSKAMVNHSLRTYYFSAILYQLSKVGQPMDREALYVAAVLHDVGLFQPAPPASEHCFSVGSAREARRIAEGAGWDNDRTNKVAVAIMTNLNPMVSLEKFGPEAHFMRAGGLIEVVAQQWKVHPENLLQILSRYPRDDFASDSIPHVRREARQNPGSRFACLNPLYSLLVPRLSFKT
jgi:hypothetical protein